VEKVGLEPDPLIPGESFSDRSLRLNSLAGVPSFELNAENLDMEGCIGSPKERCKLGLRDERLPAIAGRFEDAIFGGPITSPLFTDDDCEVLGRLLSRSES
jgi:hypothetical protein